MTQREVEAAEIREGRRSLGAWLTGAHRGLLVVGILLIGYATLTTLEAMAYNRLQVERFERLRSEAMSAPTPTLLPGEGAADGGGPLLPPGEEGALIGSLRIPRLDFEVAILEGTGATTLGHGAGHITGTALPGETGNAGVAGHRDSFFWDLQHLRVGDRIEVDTLAGAFAYVVDALEIVEPDDVRVLDYRPGRDLTLVTCYPFTYVGLAPQRYIVHAHLVEPSPAARSELGVTGWRQTAGARSR